MDTNGRPSKIHLLCTGGVSRAEEARADAEIYPGMLIRKKAAEATVEAHGTAGGAASPMFAVEDALQGRTIADPYAADELVFHVIALPGDVVLAIVPDNYDSTEGQPLTSNGDGTLKVATGSDHIIGYSMEALDAAESGVVPLAERRLRVRIK